jgi:chaperonin GroES
VKYQPIDGYIIVETQDAVKMTPGGIALPEGSQTLPARGKVIAVGKGHRILGGGHDPLNCKVGDIVLYQQGTGVDVEKGVVRLLETQLIAIVSE